MTNAEISNKLDELFRHAIFSLTNKKFTEWLCGFFGMVEVRAMKGMMLQEDDIKRLEKNLSEYQMETTNDKIQKPNR